MATFMRCKACGYIIDSTHLKDVCPACDLPKTVFEPYTKKNSPTRQFILDQHIHPVSVHFPQVLLALSLFMPLLSLFCADPWSTEFSIVAKWSIIALPWTVLAGFATGLLDGKLRFKKLNTPILRHKIIAGSILQILSFIIFAIYCSYGFSGNAPWLIAGVSLLSLPPAIYLGKVGSSLFTCIMPG